MERHGGNYSNKYSVILRKQPEKYLNKISPKLKNQFRKIFERLEINPFEISRPLHGELEGLQKVRMGDFRMIILIDKTKNQVDVVEIGPRGDIYK